MITHLVVDMLSFNLKVAGLLPPENRRLPVPSVIG